MTLTALILVYLLGLALIHREHWPNQRNRKGE